MESKGRAAEPIRLPDAEQMIDELDRIMTAYGTISVKTPDVWGQDRLAKFRSEYESQMARMAEGRLQERINASVRRSETEATLRPGGGEPRSPSHRQESDAPPPQDDRQFSMRYRSAHAGLDASLPASSRCPPTSRRSSLEPTVVLDEHSNYLNHLNQLRRINAGDDLADRPGYGLYLVRIPVTLSPGPRSRRGKGAIITVSAKSVMTKHTLRNALRNAVINETVNNLTQAICNQCDQGRRPDSGPGAGPFSLVSLRRHRAVLWARRTSSCSGRRPSISSPGTSATSPTTAARGSRSGCAASWRRRISLLEEAATPVRSAPAGSTAARSARRARRPGSPGETSPGSPRCRSAGSRGPAGLEAAGGAGVTRRGRTAAEPPQTSRTPLLRPANPGRGRQPPAEAGHGRSGSRRST